MNDEEVKKNSCTHNRLWEIAVTSQYQLITLTYSRNVDKIRNLNVTTAEFIENSKYRTLVITIKRIYNHYIQNIHKSISADIYWIFLCLSLCSCVALLVIQFNSCRKKWPVIPHFHTLWMDRSVTECALQLSQCLSSFSLPQPAHVQEGIPGQSWSTWPVCYACQLLWCCSPSRPHNQKCLMPQHPSEGLEKWPTHSWNSVSWTNRVCSDASYKVLWCWESIPVHCSSEHPGTCKISLS